MSELASGEDRRPPEAVRHGTEAKLRRASPAVDDVEARRARAAIEGRLFAGRPQEMVIGRYRLQARIGSGGMGVVYRAHDPELERDVALKLLNPDAINDTNAEQARGRLLREARTMARLPDPHVIQVYDVGTFEEGVFVAMELVEGGSLAVWLREPRPWQETLRRFIAAGRGLAAAHAAGIVHRDFKPENVLVGEDGRVRVGDFGLAGAPGSRAEDVTWDDDRPSSLTRTGAVLGTPKYMAPEQERGAPPDAASDQFSFCVALFEAIYGAPPFEGESLATYREHVRTGRVRRPIATSALPDALLSVLMQGLAPEPGQRHATMMVLLDRLEAILSPPTAPPRRPRRSIALLGLLGTGVLAAAIGWSLGQRPRPVRATASWVPVTRPIASTHRAIVAQPALELGVALEPPESLVEPTDAPPAPQTSQERSEAQGNVVARRGKRSRRAGSNCYWKEDTLHHLTHQRSATHPLLWLAGSDRCFDCSRPAQSYDVEKLGIPSGIQCTQHWLCRSVDTERCSGTPAE